MFRKQCDSHGFVQSYSHGLTKRLRASEMAKMANRVFGQCDIRIFKFSFDIGFRVWGSDLQGMPTELA